MISAGIDPGTGSYDVVAIEKGKVVYRKKLKTEEVRASPEIVIDAIEESGAEIAAGLSGYGLPVKPFSELDDVDMLLMTLNFELERAIGLRKIIKAVKERNVNLYTIPAVIHLPTVPPWRKMNRIDIGTADKLCSAVLAVAKLSEEEELTKLNFILAEVGEGFNAFIAVRNGRIVDGMGGTTSFPGYSSLGAMDAELAYLIGEFPKKLIFRGGIKSFAEDWKLGDRDVINILSEFVMKGIKAMEVSVDADFYVLSGRFAPEMLRKLREGEKEVKLLGGFGKGKQSAQGAAIIANAIAGGEYKEIVDYMRILEAKGTVLDYITSDIMEHVRRGIRRFDH
uniref:DUF1464 domain-containing protein n=1 Tax=Archaeoglobus fulgidus TaxID=2234 RepID=A0A7C3RBY5_ARCFL